MAAPELSVVCKSCGSEVSPYVTECPYCGTRLRKRAPKLERRGDELQAARRGATADAAARRERRARAARLARRRAPLRDHGRDPGPAVLLSSSAPPTSR